MKKCDQERTIVKKYSLRSSDKKDDSKRTKCSKNRTPESIHDSPFSLFLLSLRARTLLSWIRWLETAHVFFLFKPETFPYSFKILTNYYNYDYNYNLDWKGGGEDKIDINIIMR